MFGFLLVGSAPFLPPPDGYTDLIEITAAAYDQIFPQADNYFTPNLDNIIPLADTFTTILDGVTT